VAHWVRKAHINRQTQPGTSAETREKHQNSNRLITATERTSLDRHGWKLVQTLGTFSVARIRIPPSRPEQRIRGTTFPITAFRAIVPKKYFCSRRETLRWGAFFNRQQDPRCCFSTFFWEISSAKANRWDGLFWTWRDWCLARSSNSADKLAPVPKTATAKTSQATEEGRHRFPAYYSSGLNKISAKKSWVSKRVHFQDHEAQDEIKALTARPRTPPSKPADCGQKKSSLNSRPKRKLQYASRGSTGSSVSHAYEQRMKV